jgi:hypothetical protein
MERSMTQRAFILRTLGCSALVLALACDKNSSSGANGGDGDQSGDGDHSAADGGPQQGDGDHQGGDAGHQGGDGGHQGGDAGHQGGDAGHQGGDGDHQDGDAGPGIDPGQLQPPANGVVDVDPVVCKADDDAGGFTFARIATWRDDATAAYSIIHDDLCGSTLRGIDKLAVPALNMRNLTAAIGPYVQACDAGNLWNMVKDAAAKGEEIINHSSTHVNITTDNAPTEVVQARQKIQQGSGQDITFFIFPYDYFTPETIQAVGNAGHIGARAGNRDDNNGTDMPPINTAEPGSDLEVEFDVWPRTYSKYAAYYPDDVLLVHVWNAIERGGWAVREFHSVSTDPNPPADGSQGFGPVPLKTYEKHLDNLVLGWRTNKVWPSTPSTIIRYRHARKACKASVTGSKIHFDTSDADCTKFATPISVIVTTQNDVASVQATQGSEHVFTRKIAAKTFSIDADPTAGDVTLSGCSDKGPTVDTSATFPARPTPPASVCDIETVTGQGSMGRMDDLERDMAAFQTLPNPSQEDGRTGTWSWYPETAKVSIAKDGSNGVLRYQVSGVQWSGVDLAFLGGNGAGTCYDASKYTGVRFKIKGSSVSSDTLNGMIQVSVITAATRTNKFGGDLNGDGGHFHKVVPVTSDWQPVSLAFAQLDPPTWGDTSTMTSLAVKELQVIEWGGGENAVVDVEIDDIELY